MDEIIISKSGFSSPEYAEVWQLREEVLRQPLGLSLKNEDLSMDIEDAIFTAKHDSKVIGCVMLHPLDTATIKLRQMAVAHHWQGKNIGRKLVEAAEAYAHENGFITITLHARLVAAGFYQRLGYISAGEVFSEVGIDHVAMGKRV